ncbi:hypothetical protein OG985_48180 [Streptomyces sp. NBC_00289]|uniref:hypothetical protein n=1 Tax=Streptomyces sp. NBC_00289 TaxID=2975703 RepID=UPI0032535325
MNSGMFSGNFVLDEAAVEKFSDLLTDEGPMFAGYHALSEGITDVNPETPTVAN